MRIASSNMPIYVIFVSVLTLASAWRAHAAEGWTSAACSQTVNHDLYVKEKFDAFPCDISQFKKPQKIWVIGQLHQWGGLNPNLADNNAASLAEMKTFWEYVRAAAEQRQLFILDEGNAVASDGVPVTPDFYAKQMQSGYAEFAIEDGFAYASGLFSQIYISEKGTMVLTINPRASERAKLIDQFRYFSAWMLEMIWQNPYVLQGWKKAARPFLDANQERLAKKFDALACDSEGYAKIEAWLKNSSLEDLIDLDALIDEAAKNFAQSMKNIRIHKLDVPLNRFAEIIPKISTNELFNGNNGSDWQNQISTMSIPWRNQLMAANTAKVYCADLALHMDRPLVLRVGENHVPGLIAQLRAMALKSGLNPKLIMTRPAKLDSREVQSFKSYNQRK